MVNWNDRWLWSWERIVVASGGAIPARAGRHWNAYALLLVQAVVVAQGGVLPALGRSWNQDLVALLESAYRAFGGNPDVLDPARHWNQRVLDLLSVIAAAAGGGGGLPGTVRKVASSVKDPIGRFTQVNFDDGTYRTITYTTTDGWVVDVVEEFSFGGLTSTQYRANYDANGILNGWTEI